MRPLALVLIAAACGSEPDAPRFAFELHAFRPTRDSIVSVDGDAAFTSSAWAFASYAEAKSGLVVDVMTTENGATWSREIRPGICAEDFDDTTSLDVDRLVLERVQVGPTIQGVGVFALWCVDADGGTFGDDVILGGS